MSLSLTTSAQLKIELSPIFIELSTQKIKKLTFRKFQEQFAKCKTHWAILNTPTGSGKTLAALSRILFHSHTKRGLFIYPTNELINDQLISLKDLIEKLGQKTFIITTTHLEDNNWVQNLFKQLRTNSHVILFAVNGVTLYEYKEMVHKPKGKILFNILELIVASNQPCLLLTNIDTLYLILKERYAESTRILDRLVNWRHIVIDEFHLYSGISLINLIYILLLYYLIIKAYWADDYSFSLLSATPSDALQLLEDAFGTDLTNFETQCFYKIPPEAEAFSKVRERTTIYFFGRYNFLYTENDMNYLYSIVKYVISFPSFNTEQVRQKPVRLLILVNSMIFAENFFNFLKTKFKEEKIRIPIQRIHGFIPSSKRSKISELKGHILIGTRAIEIGIDFDVPFLIFEAFDKPTFLQRLGRGGRHGHCVLFCITTNLLINNLENVISKNTQKNDKMNNITMDFAVLSEQISRSLPEERTYVEIIRSNEGIKLLIPFIDSLTSNQKHQQSFFTQLDAILNISASTLPINKWNTLLKFPPIRQYLRAAISARCNLIEFPSYFEQFNSWGRLSLADLSSCDFTIKTFDELKDRNPPKLWTKYFNQSVIYVKQIKKQKSHLRLGVTGSSLRPGYIYYTTIERKLYVEGDYSNYVLEKLTKLISQIKKLPLIKVPRTILDWRIPQFEYIDGRGWRIVLGENVFLAEYLYRHFKEGHSNGAS
ncbi:MAG: type I-D CRISPR-associated helicase Cas3' [Candidatus Helarchaeota archaeon]